MDYKSIHDFLTLVRRANAKEAKDIRMSIKDANDLHTALTQLLLESKQKDLHTTRVIDGGGFKK